MSTIDEMLRAPADEALPPLVRWLKTRIALGDEFSVEVHKLEFLLGSPTFEFILRHKVDGREQEPRLDEWDDELNTALINLGVRAVDAYNEGERFALGLRGALRRVGQRYGDGYLNAVLLKLIDESDLGKSSEIAEVRKYVAANPPDSNSKTYLECRDQIASAVGARAAELREKLKYGQDDLKQIMAKAIARYLDERFSVSQRRTLGWL